MRETRLETSPSVGECIGSIVVLVMVGWPFGLVVVGVEWYQRFCLWYISDSEGPRAKVVVAGK